jgi:hydrogenase nickel incorporation protein HypA/HybF
MHEVSVMHNLLDIVEKTAAREGAEKVDVIHLRIGEMAGINYDSLEFAFEILSKGTRAEGARLEYVRVDLMGKCAECSHEFSPEELVFRCSECGSGRVDIIAGREMEVDYILLDEEGT